VACTCCGQIEDVYVDALDDLLRSIAARSGYCLAPQAGTIIYGQCAACAGMAAA